MGDILIIVLSLGKKNQHLLNCINTCYIFILIEIRINNSQHTDVGYLLHER